MAQTSDGASRKPSPAVNVGQESGGGSIPTDETGDLPKVSPRLIPVPDFPQHSVRMPPESRVKDAGKSSASFERNCAPSQAPIGDNVNYDRLSFGRLHELCIQRGYHKEDAKAALKT